MSKKCECDKNIPAIKVGEVKGIFISSEKFDIEKIDDEFMKYLEKQGKAFPLKSRSYKKLGNNNGINVEFKFK